MSIPLSISGSPQDKATMAQYHCDTRCTWCEGCGDYGIWSAVKRALVQRNIQPWQALLCYDVGCHGNTSDKLNGYRFHGLHGRVIPFAVGAKLANPRLPVLAFGGDGASFSEGIGHFVHAIRSHYPIVFVLHNNANYGLTTGQASSLTPEGQPMNSSPNGIPEHTLPLMDFVFSLEPTFVARGFSGDIPQLASILGQALDHRGFAFVDVLQACPTFNHFATHDWLLGKCRDVSTFGHDAGNLAAARKLAIETEDAIATGVLYRREDVPNFIERLTPRQGRKTTPAEEVAVTDVSHLLEKLV